MEMSPVTLTSLRCLQTVVGEKEAPSLMARLQQAWFLMQMRVNASIDSDLDRVNTEKNPGIKQVWEYT